MTTAFFVLPVISMELAAFSEVAVKLNNLPLYGVEKMKQEELQEVLANHLNWLADDNTGQKADLQGAILRGANLRGADLQKANLLDAKLRGADLEGVNLQGACLWGANLQDANLRGANLQGAYLRWANLHGANLPHFQIPQNSTLTVYKKVEGKVIKLSIPANAKRTASLVGRKCRAEYAEVLRIEGGEPVSTRGLTYVQGETVYPDSYDSDIRVECTNGIHFFLTEIEAKEY